MKEAELVEKIVRFFTQDGYQVKQEVPNMGQRADLVAVADDDKITIIEAKINHKKRVLEQCVAHNIVADYICIAWGGKNVSSSLYNEAKRSGYGIILYSPVADRCDWTIKPELNKNFWEPQRRVLMRNMKELPDVTY